MNEWLADSWGLVTLVFVAGTLAVSFSAARTWPARPWRSAVLGGLAFEGALLLILRPGLGANAVMIAVTCTILLALVGAAVANSRKRVGQKS